MKLEDLTNKCLNENEKEQYTLKRVDILSPYISESFFKKLVELEPRKVYITTDAGCSSKIVEAVKKTLGNKLGKIKHAHCKGIVHAKCYLFIWENPTTKKCKRLFLWGSCNATDGGFERNAEVFSWILLSKINQAKRRMILKYFSVLRDNDKNVSGVELKLGNWLTIELPKIECYTTNASTFDLWIQKGRLCHSFQNDPSFRHLRMKLEKNISPKGELLDALQTNNIGINQQTTITYDYLRHNPSLDKDVEVDDDSMWKSKYFVDTVYGFWTSEDCYKNKYKKFHKNDTVKRKREFNLISTADEHQRKKWTKEFLEKLKLINDAISNPSEYFHYKDGSLDIEKYEKQFENQLNRDFIRAKSSLFKRRYISGYEFIEVPPLREFSSHWNKFIQSFLESLYFEIKKPRSRSLLAQTIRDDTGIGDLLEEFGTLSTELKTNWNDHKAQIEDFYTKRK